MNKEQFLDKWIECLPLNSKDQDRKEMSYDLDLLMGKGRKERIMKAENNFIQAMETYYWATEEYHADNNVTMSEYLEMQENFSYEQHLTIDYVDGTYAEGTDCKGNRWAIHASGNGDSFHHKIEFELLKSAVGNVC